MADFNEFGFALVVYAFHYASVITASLVLENLFYDFVFMVVAPRIKGVFGPVATEGALFVYRNG